jgi:hypothetical protein
MRRALTVVLAVPLLVLLAACAPAAHGGIPTKHHTTASSSTAPSASPTPSVSAPAPATATPAPAPVKVTPPAINQADYLVKGTPHHPDSNGEWFGEWAFWTDSTKTVWCQFTIFSGDNPASNCSIVPSARSQVTYPIPAGSSAGCATSNWDGYTLGLDASVDDLIPKDAGWDQCWVHGVAVVTAPATTKVLPDGATLTVAPFSCTVHAGVATCKNVSTSSNPSSAYITLGLHAASFHSD